MTERRLCNPVNDYHVDVYTDIDDNDVLYDICDNCGEVWISGKTTPERAAAVRRAVAVYRRHG